MNRYLVHSRANRVLDSLLHRCYDRLMSRIPTYRTPAMPTSPDPENSIFSHKLRYQDKLKEGQNVTDSMKMYNMLKLRTPAAHGAHVAYNSIYKLPGTMTKQEYGTAVAILNGISMREIAAMYDVKLEAIERRMQRLMKKLGIGDSRDLLQKAIERIDYDNLR